MVRKWNGAIRQDRQRTSHLSGYFCGYSHSTPRNINYKESFFTPVFSHNLYTYDSHFIRNLAKQGCICLLPDNEENYIRFTKYTQTEVKFHCIFRLFRLSSGILLCSQEILNGIFLVAEIFMSIWNYIWKQTPLSRCFEEFQSNSLHNLWSGFYAFVYFVWFFL